MSQTPLVLHLIPTLAMAGAERVVIELAARLPEEGFRTKIIALFEGGSFADDLRRRDIRWTQLLSSNAGSRMELLSRLNGLMRDDARGPAIIHTHLFGGDFYGALAKRLSHGRVTAPLISTAHNIDHDDSTLRRLARRWAVRQMDQVVAISGAVARYEKRNLGVREDRIQVIPNGVELSRITKRHLRPFHDIPRLLCVGRLEAQKGHAILLNALANVPPPWMLEIVGTGSLERDLRELAERLGIASRVHFLGEQRDVHEQRYAEADLFCFPSQWEGMGLVLAEAMAAGVPILASNLPAIREYASASRLVDPASIDDWTAAIRDTLADPASAIATAQKAEPGIRKKFGLEQMVSSYADLYRQIIRGPSSSHPTRRSTSRRHHAAHS